MKKKITYKDYSQKMDKILNSGKPVHEVLIDAIEEGSKYKIIGKLPKNWGRVKNAPPSIFEDRSIHRCPEIRKRIKSLLVSLQNDTNKKIRITPLINEIMSYIVDNYNNNCKS